MERASKRIKVDETEALLHVLRGRFPKSLFRISRRGNIQKKTGKVWLKVCKHGIEKTKCRDETCGGGSAFCMHGPQKVKCKIGTCGGGSANCEHGIRKDHCPESQCNGGTGLCIQCKKRTKKQGDYCISCHPDFIPSLSGASKIGCQFICDIQRILNRDIQHMHYDKVSKSVIGSEFSLPEHKRKKVDGYFEDAQGQRVVLEFLGDRYHGHPSLWASNHNAVNHLKENHKENFENTQRILATVASFGYTVLYAWESDYKRLGALQSVISILRVFKGKLEH